MGFVRTLLIILAIYYALKLIKRYVLPILMTKMMQNVEKKFNEQQGRATTQNQNVKEGETVVDKAPNTNIKRNNDVGEYVDYEDVE